MLKEVFKISIELPNKPKLAMMIDFENANQKNLIPEFFSYLEKRGFLCYPRKLITSKITSLENTNKLIKENNLELIVSNRPLVKNHNRNNADFRMYIETLDCLYNCNVDAFCIVSSDDDFLELVLKLKRAGKYLIGIGALNTSSDYQKHFDEFLFIEDFDKMIQERKKALEEMKRKEEQLKQQEKLRQQKEKNEEKKLKLEIQKKKKEDAKRKLQSEQKLYQQKIKAAIDTAIKSHHDGWYPLTSIIKDIKENDPSLKKKRIPLKIFDELGYDYKIEEGNSENKYIEIKKEVLS